MGADLHGQDVTKAAQRAIRDAVSRSCLCGLMDIFKFKNPNQMYIRLKVSSPFPDKLDLNKLKESVPFGTVELTVEEGGLVTEGLDLPMLGQGDKIVVVLASITVMVDMDEFWALNPEKK
jgi:uncharacterized protein (TIGR02058 family)